MLTVGASTTISGGRKAFGLHAVAVAAYSAWLLTIVACGQARDANEGTPVGISTPTPAPYPVSTVDPGLRPTAAPRPSIASTSPTVDGGLQALRAGASSPPAGWPGTVGRERDLELSLYLPRLDYTADERETAVLMLRNVSGSSLEVVLPCGNAFQLTVRDASGQVVYDWTREHYPSPPGSALMPPCPRGSRVLAPGDAIQGSLEFVVVGSGALSVGASRFGNSTPLVEEHITARP